MEIYFKPLGDRVLVLAENQSKENKSKSGLILTDSVQRGQKVQGKVVAVGGGVGGVVASFVGGVWGVGVGLGLLTATPAPVPAPAPTV